MSYIAVGNMTTDTIGGIKYFNERMAYLLPYIIIYILIVIFGIFGNLLVMSSIAVVKELHNTTNMIVFNLSLLEFMICLLVDTFTIFGVLAGQEYFSQTKRLCEFVAATCMVICIATLMSILLLALNRFIHICYPKHYERIFSKWKTLILCISTWIIGLLFDAGNMAGWGGHVYDIKSLSCIWDRLASRSYSLFMPFTGILFPCVLIFYCYIRIFLQVYKTSFRAVAPEKALSNNVSNKNDFKNAKEMKKSFTVAKTLFICFAVFLTCWVPYGLLILFDSGDYFPSWGYMYAELLAHIDPAINPILYAVLNPSLKNGFIKLLGMLKTCKAQQHDSSSINTTSLTKKAQNTSV